ARADAVLELLAGAKPLKHGTRVRFHQGTAEILGRVAIVSPTGDRDADTETTRKGSAPQIAPGSRAFVRLRLERPAVLTRGDRFILRAYSPPVTIAGGQVLDPRPPRTAIRTEAAVDRFRLLDIPNADGHEADL